MDSDQTALLELINGIRLGKRQAQRLLYERYYAYAKTICLQYSSSESEAVEILNDGFLKILTNIDLYDSHYSFNTWLRRVMINKAIDYYRKNRVSSFVLSLNEYNGPDLCTFDFPDLDEIEDLLPCLRKLSPAYRLVLNLFILEEYTHDEIAEKLNISASTSRSNLSRALLKLRELLKPNREIDLKLIRNGTIL